MRRNGFTLIELLAVIVILAIIALIATPIVLNIIDETKASAQLRSAEFYLDAVEQAVMKKNMSSAGLFKPVECDIYDGNLDCNGVPVEVEVSGEVPKAGKIKFKDGNIFNVEIDLSGEQIVMDENKNLKFKESFSPMYSIGQSFENFDPGDGIERDWNIIGEDEDTVTLMLNRNLDEVVQWYVDNDDNGYGPVTAMTYLYNETKDWTKAEPINYTYNEVESEYGYTSFISINGVSTITGKSSATIGTKTEPLRARMLSLDEIIKISSQVNTILEEENLKTSIEKHMEDINSLGIFETTFSEPQELVDEFTNLLGLNNYSNAIKAYYTALLLQDFDIIVLEKKEDILMPEFMYNGLNGAQDSYWSFSSYGTSDSGKWYVCSEGIANNSIFSGSIISGVRPVITVQKSNLKKN